MNTFYRSFFVTISLMGWACMPVAVRADYIAPELYISAAGATVARGAQIMRIHALNLISIAVWGQKWMVNISYATKLESSDGTEIKLEQLGVGHILEIKAEPSSFQEGTLNASMIRDLSIGNGTFASGKMSLLDSICPVRAPISTSKSISTPTPIIIPKPTPTPIPSSSPKPLSVPTPLSAAALLTQTLARGAKGSEVVLLQQFLQKNGFGIPDDGPVTGIFGKVTEQAVKNFQIKNGFDPMGIIGEKTRALINQMLHTH